MDWDLRFLQWRKPADSPACIRLIGARCGQMNWCSWYRRVDSRKWGVDTWLKPVAFVSQVHCIYTVWRLLVWMTFRIVENFIRRGLVVGRELFDILYEYSKHIRHAALQRWMIWVGGVWRLKDRTHLRSTPVTPCSVNFYRWLTSACFLLADVLRNLPLSWRWHLN